jgi:hypothetical protein
MRLWSLTLIGVCITPVTIALGVGLRSHRAIESNDEVAVSPPEAGAIANFAPGFAATQSEGA